MALQWTWKLVLNPSISWQRRWCSHNCKTIIIGFSPHLALTQCPLAVISQVRVVICPNWHSVSAPPCSLFLGSDGDPSKCQGGDRRRNCFPRRFLECKALHCTLHPTPDYLSKIPLENWGYLGEKTEKNARNSLHLGEMFDFWCQPGKRGA